MPANQPYKAFLSFMVLLIVCAGYPGWAALEAAQDSTISGELNPDRPVTISETVLGGKNTEGSDDLATTITENPETLPATRIGEDLGETFLGGTVTTEQVVERTAETEHYFDSNDMESDGILILTIRAANSPTLDSAEQPLVDSYVLWDWSGTINIPDGPDGAWVGIICEAPSVPAGSEVTKVTVHHEITHTYIGDLEVKVYNSSHTWMVRDNEGGPADNINETRTQYSLFDGDNPNQTWNYRVRDTAGLDTGTLNVMQLYVYYSTPEPPKADLTPDQRSNWNDKIPIGIQQLAYDQDHTYNGPYYSDQTLYFNWRSLNQGDVDASTYCVHFEVTGPDNDLWNWCSLNTCSGCATMLTNDEPVGPLSPGQYRFRVWLDYTNVVDEGANEGNNYYERTITVEEGPSWVLLYYFCNGGDLEGGCESKFRAIANAAVSSNFRAYVLWDHVNGEDRVFRMKSNSDWINGYTRGTDYWTATDIGLPGSEMNTGDVGTLNRFVDFVLDREHADHYGLTIFNHGGGIHPTVTADGNTVEIITGVCFDQNPSDYLSIRELGQGCSHFESVLGRNLDILQIDACLMQMIEINHEVRSHCDYLIASENEGWTFTGGTSWEGDYLNDITSALSQLN